MLKFTRALEREPISIPHAALLMAQAVAYPELDVGLWLRRLDELADEAADSISDSKSIRKDSIELAARLFGDQGLRGNQKDYMDPRNSFLNDVFERKLGIPISLCVIYVAVAQRLGLPAYGIALPGHFIVGVEDEAAPLWLDPFYGGRVLEMEDCRQLVALTTGYEGPLPDRWLQPAEPRDIIIRMLNNLRNTYLLREAWQPAMRVVELLRVSEPEAAGHVRDLGLLYLRLGSLRAAADHLGTYLERSPEATDGERIRDQLLQTLDQLARLN